MHKFLVFLITLNTTTLNWACQFSEVVNTKADPTDQNTAGIEPDQYVTLLGKGLDVERAKTAKGIANYDAKVVSDFKQIGLSHVRIHIKKNAEEDFLKHLDKVINDCLKEEFIPIISYQGDEFKKNPNQENFDKVVEWWKMASSRYRDYSPLLAFEILIEISDALNNELEVLNDLYEQTVSEIRKTNPTRIIFISPEFRSSPEYLSDLKIPTHHNNFLMVEWHFYASGPSKTNANKLWTSGTEAEKNIIRQKTKRAMNWQNEKGIYTWVGGWMPGNYNDGDDYTIEEQVAFASFVTFELEKYNIPFAVNSDTKFYDRETNTWIAERMPVLQAILHPDCKE